MPLWRLPSKRSRGEAAPDVVGAEDAALREALDRLLAPFEPWSGEDEPPPPPKPAPAAVAADVSPAPRRSVRERLVVRYTLPPAAIVVLSAAAAMLVFAVPESPLRPYAVLAFALVCPGCALVRLVALPDPLLELAAGVGLSIAIQTLVSTAMLYAHAWSPGVLFAGLVVVAVSGASAELLGFANRTRSAL